MGVPRLWEILKPARETCSFTELCLSQGYERDRSGRRLFSIGVDASIWMKQACPVFRFAHHNAGQAPELRILFHKLARLHTLLTTAVFVFDGTERPLRKRGITRTRTTPHWLEDQFRALIKLFGFSIHEAPGEAEAELAQMNRTCIIDSVLSDDSDVLLFGAFSCMPNPKIKVDGDDITVYSSASIQAKLRLNRGGLLCVGLLNGGDYHKGLADCGIKTAYAIARYGLGDRLVYAGCHYTDDELKAFLMEWRIELYNMLRDDPRGFIGRRQKSPKVPNDFPKMNVLRAYAKPLTSWSIGRTANVPRPRSRSADISGLVVFGCAQFGWSAERAHKMMKSHLWHGFYLRLLCPAIETDLSTSSSMLHVVSTSSNNSYKNYRIRVQADIILALIEKGLPIVNDTQPSTLSKTFLLTVPLSIVRIALPSMVRAGDESMCVTDADTNMSSSISACNSIDFDDDLDSNVADSDMDSIFSVGC